MSTLCAQATSAERRPPGTGRRAFGHLGVISLAALAASAMVACGGGAADANSADAGTGEPPPAVANQVPSANAGPDQSANGGAAITLAGAASTDSDGNIVSYQWTQAQGPIVTLAADGSGASFTAPTVTTDTTLAFVLAVTDDKGATSTDSVVLTVAAAAPATATSFVFNGIRYSAKPVFDGQITGFGYDAAGAGVSDGEASGARVWYGADACLSFRQDGSGMRDKKGGTATTIDSFPWKPVIFVPGTQQAGLVRMRGYNSPIDRAPDPQYARRSELQPFQWGVRLDADGTVHVNSRGNYEVLLQLEDGTRIGSDWDPQTNLPSTSPFSGNSAVRNQLAAYSNALPAESHFCTFRERTSVSLEPRCVETSVANGSGSGTRKLCYDAGMLQGAYSFTGIDGALRETGKFHDNRPAEGWTFWRDDGTLLASGNFNAEGAHTGTWSYHDPAGALSEQAPFTGTLVPSGREPYHRVLDGHYAKYYPGSRVISEESGRLLAGQRDGWWNTYEPSSDAGTNGQRIREEAEYDASTQVGDGQFCYGAGDCVTTTHSWLKTRRKYSWGGCFGKIMSEVRYNTNGSFAGETCYTINGTPASFTTEVRPSCPSVSCQ